MVFSRAILDANTATRIAHADAYARIVAPLIGEIRAGGVCSFKAIAKQLNERGSTTSRGKVWSDVQVRRVLMRLERL